MLLAFAVSLSLVQAAPAVSAPWWGVLSQASVLLERGSAVPPAEVEIPPPAEVIAPRASEPPTIDGALDEAVWQATALPIAYRVFTDQPAQSPTMAHIAWDRDDLYLAFEVTDRDIWSTKTEQDTDLWVEEVVEAFVDPDGDGRDYLEFEVNPLGTVVDLLIPEVRNGSVGDWHENIRWGAPGWLSAVQVRGTVDNREDTDEGWTAEWAIPWECLGIEHPKLATTFHLGLFRCEVPEQGDTEYLSWSPARAFHSPRDFGHVTLGTEP